MPRPRRVARKIIRKGDANRSMLARWNAMPDPAKVRWADRLDAALGRKYYVNEDGSIEKRPPKYPDAPSQLVRLRQRRMR